MKITTLIFLTILLSCLFKNNLKAQAITKDTATYEYAVLTLSGKSLNVVFDSKQNVSVLDLDERLHLDTLQVGTRLTRYYKYLFTGMHFMDNMGYELVSYAPHQYFESCLYRKRKTLK